MVLVSFHFTLFIPTDRINLFFFKPSLAPFQGFPQGHVSQNLFDTPNQLCHFVTYYNLLLTLWPLSFMKNSFFVSVVKSSRTFHFVCEVFRGRLSLNHLHTREHCKFFCFAKKGNHFDENMEKTLKKERTHTLTHSHMHVNANTDMYGIQRLKSSFPSS